MLDLPKEYPYKKTRIRAIFLPAFLTVAPWIFLNSAHRHQNGQSFTSIRLDHGAGVTTVGITDWYYIVLMVLSGLLALLLWIMFFRNFGSQKIIKLGVDAISGPAIFSKREIVIPYVEINRVWEKMVRNPKRPEIGLLFVQAPNKKIVIADGSLESRDGYLEIKEFMASFAAQRGVWEGTK